MIRDVNWEVVDLILRRKPALMMLQLLHNSSMYASNLAKSIDCTYSHVVKLLSELEKQGLVTLQRHGRLKIINLTKKGREVAKNLENLIKCSR